VLALALLLVGAAFLPGCRTTEPVVKIGLVGPFEGRHRPVGYDVIYSARLAVRETNLAGGVGNYRVGLVALDDSGDPDLAAGAARALVTDPAVVAVIGHWLPETTAVAGPIYAAAGMPFLPAGSDPIGPVDPGVLPATFRAAYEEVTPFDEQAGPYAGTAYDGLTYLIEAMFTASSQDGIINRETVAATLPDLRVQGLTGPISRP
jgi:ABC-type branched-subunit amino acid transport system substrate-binding protein